MSTPQEIPEGGDCIQGRERYLSFSLLREEILLNEGRTHVNDDRRKKVFNSQEEKGSNYNLKKKGANF